MGCAAVLVASVALAQEPRPVHAAVAQTLPGEGRAERLSLDPVNSAVVGRDGRLVIAQRATMSVKVFSADGRLARSIGRRGDGPGEFRDVTEVGLLFDTLWVSDGRLRRVSFFSPEGRLLRTQPYTNLGGRASLLGLLTGGFVLSADVELERVSGVDTVYLATVRLSSPTAQPASRTMVSVRSAPDVFRFSLSPDGSAGVSLRAPFASRPLVKALPDGSGFVVVDAPRPTASTAFADVAVHRPDGGRRSHRQVPLQVRRLSRGFVDTLVSLAVLQASSGGVTPPHAERERYRRWLLRNEWVPPFSELLVDHSGAALLQYAQEPGRWLLVPASSQLAGDLPLPERVIPVAFAGRNLWALRFDAFDTPELVLYRIDAAPLRQVR